MDPAILTLLTTYGIPLLTALLGIVVKHYFPTLGNSLLGNAASTSPASAASPSFATPTAATVLHPLLSRLFNTSGAHPVLNAILQDSLQLAEPASPISPAGQPVAPTAQAKS